MNNLLYRPPYRPLYYKRTVIIDVVRPAYSYRLNIYTTLAIRLLLFHTKLSCRIIRLTLISSKKSPSLLSRPNKRIIRSSEISKLSPQAIQHRTAAYKRSSYPSHTVSLLLATDRVTCHGWKETLLSMCFTNLATESQQQRLLRGLTIKFLAQPTFGPGLNPWGVNYLTTVSPASATFRRILMLYKVLNKVLDPQIYALYYIVSLSSSLLNTNDLHTCLYEAIIPTNTLDLLRLPNPTRTTDMPDASRLVITQTTDSCQTDDSCQTSGGGHPRGCCQTVDCYDISRRIGYEPIYVDNLAL